MSVAIVTSVADARVASGNRVAGGKRVTVVSGRTLVHRGTVLTVAVVARSAGASERAGDVRANRMSTVAIRVKGRIAALINVHAGIGPTAGITSVARANERAVGVRTESVRMTVVGAFDTLVDLPTESSVAAISRTAGTSERGDSVLAVSMGIASVDSGGTLVNRDTNGAIPSVALVATTGVGPEAVLAPGVGVAIGPSGGRALVDVIAENPVSTIAGVAGASE